MSIKREHKLELSSIHHNHCLYIIGYKHTLDAVYAEEFGTVSLLTGNHGYKLSLYEGYPADAVAKELEKRFKRLS